MDSAELEIARGLAAEDLVPYPPFVSRTIRGNAYFGRGRLIRVIPGGEGRLEHTPAAAGLVGRGRLVQASYARSLTEAVDIDRPPLPSPTFPFEWTAEMLRDAAHTALDVAAEMGEAGYPPADLNPWCISFRGTSPVFLDYGIFGSPDPSMLFERAFERSFVAPLRIMGEGFGVLARSLMLKRIEIEPLDVPPSRPGAFVSRAFGGFAPKIIPRRLRQIVRGRRRGASTLPFARRIERLRALLEAAPRPPVTSRWNGYYRGRDLDWRESSLEKKARLVADAISGIQIRDVLDLGCNRGFHGFMFARRGHRVVSIDSDEGCVSAAYSVAKKEGLPVTPAIMSIAAPSPAPGHRNGYLLSAGERLGCDLVLMLAVIHHLALRQGMNFVLIAETLAEFSRRYALVEFVDGDDRTNAMSAVPIPAWYNEESLIADFSRSFRLVRRSPSVSPSRRLLLFEKISG